MRATTLLVLALLFLAPPLAADGPPWVPLGPGGGHVTSIAVSPFNPKVAYAVTWTGIYRSLNAGALWVEIEGLDGASQLVPDPFRPLTVYARPFDRVFKSVDGGATWIAFAPVGLPPGYPVFGLTADPSRPSRLYLGTALSGVWVSDNGGASWRYASRRLPVILTTAVAAARRPSGTAFVGTIAGLYRTRNAGALWSRVGRSLPAENILSVLVSPSDSRIVYASLESGFYRSQDGGASWAQATDRVLTGLKVHPKVASTIFALGQGEDLLKSTDSGRSWEPLGPTPEVDIQAFDIHAGPAGDALWLGTSPKELEVGGVRVSTDNGARWAVRNRGLHDLPVEAVGVDAEGNLLAGTQGQGVFRLTNPRFPPLWTRTHAGSPFTSGSVSAGEIVNAGPGLFFATLASGLPATDSLWRTSDGGRTWSVVPVPGLESPFDLAADPHVEGTVYVLSPQGLARTQDGGETWTPLTRPPFGCDTGAIAVAPSSPPGARVLYAAGASPDIASFCQNPQPWVFRSSDGGASWVDVSAGLTGNATGPLAVDPLDANVVYVATRGFSAANPSGVLKSADGGATWTQTGALPPYVNGLMVPPIPGRVYATLEVSGSLAGILRSDDGGATWRYWSEGMGEIQVLDLALDPGDPSRLYAATNSGVWALEEED